MENLPKTFIITSSECEEMVKFKEYFSNLTNKKQSFILKPGEFSNRGKRIILANSLDKIIEYGYQ